MSSFPSNINVHAQDGYLEITWASGETCRYPLSELREACPCVECRGGHQNMGMSHAPKDILSLTPARSYHFDQAPELIGNYALQFFWDDGHHAGIYTWEYLHKLCPKEPQA